MDLQRLMKEAQKMQNNVSKIEKELNETVYEGQSGPVKVTVMGTYEVASVEIDEEILAAENKEELQDMIMLAVNAAVKSAHEDRDKKMGAVTAGISMPGMMR